MQKQKTLAASFSLKGKGLHTGLDIEITFNPAPENHGYKIKRVDMEGQPTIDALAENVVNTQRGTVLSKNGVQVSTIEHAMAALYAYEIDNCLIEVNAPEFPILDGSSRFFSEEIQKTGVVEQNAPKDYYIVKHKIEVKDEETGSSLIILPDDKFSVNVLISFDSPVLSNQFATLNDLSEFPTELAGFTYVRIRTRSGDVAQPQLDQGWRFRQRDRYLRPEDTARIFGQIGRYAEHPSQECAGIRLYQ